jgi:hypothetical protein
MRPILFGETGVIAVAWRLVTKFFEAPSGVPDALAAQFIFTTWLKSL